MAEVKVGENETLDSAIKRWKRKCQKDGIIGDIRKKEAYEKHPFGTLNLKIEDALAVEANPKIVS